MQKVPVSACRVCTDDYPGTYRDSAHQMAYMQKQAFSALLALSADDD